jgi:hypothetical protein
MIGAMAGPAICSKFQWVDLDLHTAESRLGDQTAPVAPEIYIRAYRWCSPPRIGYATMSPNLSIGRVQGVSFPSLDVSSHLIIIARIFRKNSPKVLRVESRPAAR